MTGAVDWPGVRAKIGEVQAHGNMSLRELARAAGVPQSGLSQFMTGKAATLRLETCEALAAVAGEDLGGFLGLAPANGVRPDGRPDEGLLALRHDQLLPDPDQPRKHFDEERLAELAASIAEMDVIEPLVVDAVPDTGGRHTIRAGERRWRAVGLLIAEERWHPDRTIRCVPRALDPDGGLALQIVENLQREDLAPMEEARAYVRLRDAHGWPTAQIARAVGRTQRHVQLRLALEDRLGNAAVAALEAGDLPASSARHLTRLDLEGQAAVLDQILKGTCGAGEQSVSRAVDLWLEGERQAAAQEAPGADQPATQAAGGGDGQADIEEFTGAPQAFRLPIGISDTVRFDIAETDGGWIWTALVNLFASDRYSGKSAAPCDDEAQAVRDAAGWMARATAQRLAGGAHPQRRKLRRVLDWANELIFERGGETVAVPDRDPEPAAGIGRNEPPPAPGPGLTKHLDAGKAAGGARGPDEQPRAGWRIVAWSGHSTHGIPRELDVEAGGKRVRFIYFREVDDEGGES